MSDYKKGDAILANARHREEHQMEVLSSDDDSVEVRELKEEIAEDDMLLRAYYQLMDVIPKCPVHGNRCIPHAIEWVLCKLAALSEQEEE